MSFFVRSLQASAISVPTRLGPLPILLTFVAIAAIPLFKSSRRAHWRRDLIRLTSWMTMFVWASNLTWVLFIINLPLFKEEFASANRNWSLAISMYAIVLGLPLFSMALLWADIDHPPLTRMGLELVPRLMTTCSVIVSLEAFLTNPSKGWLANDAALFGRGLYVAAVITGCAFSLLLVYVRDPGTPQPGLLRGPMPVQVGLNRGDIDLRIIDTLNQSTLTALVLLLSFP